LAAVYGRTVPRFAEHAPLRPLSVYANTMAFGEVQTALQLGAVGTSHAVVRYFSVYGEPQVMKSGSHSWVVAWFAARAALGLPLQLNGGGHQVRDLVHVDDIADGTLHLTAAHRVLRPQPRHMTPLHVPVLVGDVRVLCLVPNIQDTDPPPSAMFSSALKKRSTSWKPPWHESSAPCRRTEKSAQACTDERAQSWDRDDERARRTLRPSGCPRASMDSPEVWTWSTRA
jgi:nucleoside-diphosphate-sugar epimerase